jgi:hypothetical protein
MEVPEMARKMPPKEYVPFTERPQFIVQRKQSYYRFRDCYYSEYHGGYYSEYEWFFEHRGKWYRHVNTYVSEKPKTANFDDGIWGKPYLAVWLDANGKSWGYEHPNKRRVG